MKRTTKCNEAIMDFIKTNYKGRSNNELTEMINKKFNKNLKVSSVRRYKNLEHLKSGIDTRYQEKYEAGGERDFQSYTLVKINNHLWRNKGAVEYEKAFGAVPKGYNVIYLDGNAKNCDIDNLACISNAELGALIKYGKNNGNAEIRQTKINLVKLKAAIKEKKQKGRGK